MKINISNTCAALIIWMIFWSFVNQHSNGFTDFGKETIFTIIRLTLLVGISVMRGYYIRKNNEVDEYRSQD